MTSRVIRMGHVEQSRNHEAWCFAERTRQADEIPAWGAAVDGWPAGLGVAGAAPDAGFGKALAGTDENLELEGQESRPDE